MTDKRPRNERWEAFDRIWSKGKNGKMRMRLMEKCNIRGLEPTEANCRDYWMGYIRYYVNAWTGKGIHCNPRKNKSVMKSLKRSKIDAEQKEKRRGKKGTHGLSRYNKNKKRRFNR